MKRFKLLLVFVLACALFFPINPVFAEILIEVTNNGSGSTNDVQVAVVNDTQVAQSNDANVTNATQESTDTGTNTISDSQGTSSITTGDSTNASSIQNSFNSSTVTTGCCPDNSSIIISNNGSGSTNTVVADDFRQTIISTSQTAIINNFVSTKANTGWNRITSNHGNSSIEAGDSTGDTRIINTANSTFILASQGRSNFDIVIKGNGEGSVNDVEVTFGGRLIIANSVLAIITNDIYVDLGTGNNYIKDALGDQSIKTGDARSEVIVKNDPVNDNKIVINNCKDDGSGEEVEPPPGNGGGHGGPPQPDTIPPSNGNTQPQQDNGNGTGPSNNGNGTVGGGQVLAMLAQVLPATGAVIHSWMLTVVYLLMFLLGLYLRLRAGRSPDYVYS